MGFLDKLLGRSKETTEGVEESARDTGDATKDPFEGDEGVSDVTESEQRLDDIRDQTMRDEGRMP